MNISCPGSWDLPKHMNSITEVIYFLRGSCLKKLNVLKWKKNILDLFVRVFNVHCLSGGLYCIFLRIITCGGK